MNMVVAVQTRKINADAANQIVGFQIYTWQVAETRKRSIRRGKCLLPPPCATASPACPLIGTSSYFTKVVIGMT